MPSKSKARPLRILIGQEIGHCRRNCSQRHLLRQLLQRGCLVLIFLQSRALQAMIRKSLYPAPFYTGSRT